jgi:hypothetical protein
MLLAGSAAPAGTAGRKIASRAIDATTMDRRVRRNMRAEERDVWTSAMDGPLFVAPDATDIDASADPQIVPADAFRSGCRRRRFATGGCRAAETARQPLPMSPVDLLLARHAESSVRKNLKALNGNAPATLLAGAVGALGDPVQCTGDLLDVAPGGDQQFSPVVGLPGVTGVGVEFGQFSQPGGLCGEVVGQGRSQVSRPTVVDSSVVNAHGVPFEGSGKEKGPKLNGFALTVVLRCNDSAGGPRPVRTRLDSLCVGRTGTTRPAAIAPRAALRADTSVTAGEQNITGGMPPP